ncbi:MULTISPECIES: hypothetical protein [Catenuloplanes]|uniref:Integral membrane protein n=1 Tax=Catenuloplanes niger TaxID=587534 RepID=A0AAE3ZI22_9ACTN|nr:hypothetical protein [Catenuloplanes niger]MDR7320344.1 hypothetical protein [Catenuloplanes niger]
MTGYVNDGRAGWTELRVHGVSGTPPDRMLQHAQVAVVAGDENAAFHRRRWESRDAAADTDGERAEAYFWGGLTAGAGQRALWLLLTPFMLVNVAFFALPPLSGAVRRIVEALLRLFALSITVTFVLVPVQVAMDLVGWQCARAGRDCALRFLTWDWLDTPGRRLAVTALVPLAVVALLWWLGRSTWSRLETTEVPGAVPVEAFRTPLENRRLWNGRAPVRRLRDVHVGAALAVTGVFLTAPLTSAPARAVLTALLVLLGAAAVLVCLPSIGSRPVPPPGSAPPPDADGRYRLLPAAAGLAVAAAVLVAAAADRDAARPDRSLPMIAEAAQGLVAGQLLVLFAVAVLLYGRAPGAAWRGLGAAALMLASLGFVAASAAGAGIRVADMLGDPTAGATGAHAVVVPAGYFSAGAATSVLAAVALLLAAAGAWRVHRAAGRVDAELPRHYADADLAADPAGRRRRLIARTWARAAVGDQLQLLLGWFLAITALVVTGGFALFLRDPRWLLRHAPGLVDAGTVLAGGFVVLLLWAGRRAYQNPNFRRTVGMLWDVGTFWPRAVHPLAPPCYAERAVPDLLTRISYLGDARDGGLVLLSCHSQGSVLGAAVIAQLTYPVSGAVGLLTYGSPLHRLYGRFFPAYFSPAALDRTGSLLLGPGGDHRPRAEWPWRNLYRRSDPIGGAVLGPDPDVDRALVDPAFTRVAGDTVDPVVRGHSNYWADPAFAASAALVKALRVRFPSSARDTAGPPDSAEAGS